MVLWLIRLFYMLTVLASAWLFVVTPEIRGNVGWESKLTFYIAIPLMVCMVLILLDLSSRRKNLQSISGLFFGVLAGLVFAYALGMLVDFVVIFMEVDPSLGIIALVKTVLAASCVYLCVSFVMQTRDDFRFIIPYVDFSRQSKGVHPVLLDTSILIDGRITDIVETRILDCPLIIPRFVLNELHTLSDSADSLKRNRGRRGLDMLKKLQSNRDLDLAILSFRNVKVDSARGVDNKLIELALDMDARVMTTDFNLNKVAELRGVVVINLNELANTMKAVAIPGERMRLKIIRQGESSEQGVGFLEDGTMVVVEDGGHSIGKEVEIGITSMIQTSAGKMVFGRIDTSNRNEKR